MAEICEKCGDKGYMDCLIYCSQCKVAVEHLYCLDNRPDRNVHVTWSCEQCAHRASSSSNKCSLRTVRRSKRLKIRKRKKIHKKNKVHNLSKAETNVQNCGPTTIALQSLSLCLKGDTQRNEDMLDPAEVRSDILACMGNYHQYFSYDNREGPEKPKKGGRKLLLDDEGISEEDTGSAEDKNSPVVPDVGNVLGLSSGEGAKSLKRQGRKLILDDECISEEDIGSAEDGNPLVASDVRKVPFGLSRHKPFPVGLPVEITTDPLLRERDYHQQNSDGCHEGAKKLKNQRRKLILDVGRISSEDNGIAEERNSPVAPDVSNAPVFASRKPSPENGCYGPARPIIDPAWRGCFSICNGDSCKVGIVAHLSNKACFKVLQGANALPVFLGLEMLPRPDVWPKSFSRLPPIDDNIGLYFFPESKRDKAAFSGLLYDVIDRDLALKAVTDNAELLIFSSDQLPPLFQRFQGEYYLWGVFRGKQVSDPPKPAEHLLIQDCSIECDRSSISTDDFGSQRGRRPIEFGRQWSPFSPLSSYRSDSPHSPLHQRAMSSGFSGLACPDIIEKAVDNGQDLEKQNAHEKEERQYVYADKVKQCEYEEGEIQTKDSDVVLLTSGGPWLGSASASGENIGFEGSCLELFPLEMENIAVVSKARSSSKVDLELALGRPGRVASKNRSPGHKQLMDAYILGLNDGTF